MKTRNSFIFSLATAIGITLNSLNADVLGSLTRANNARETNWTVAAQEFIAAFNELDKGIRDILKEKDAKPACDTAITLSLWKQNLLLPKYRDRSWLYRQHLTEDCVNNMRRCSRPGMHALFWDSRHVGMGRFMTWSMTPILGAGLAVNAAVLDKAGIAAYYYLDVVQPPLKKYICETLGVRSLKEAANVWSRRFVAPVSQLLIDHAGEMKKSDKTLQLLLDLYRAYHSCEIIVSADFSDDFSGTYQGFSRSCGRFTEEELDYVPLTSFKDVFQTFHAYLADAIANCSSPEMENILVAILTESDQKTMIGSQWYFGSDHYRLNIRQLMSNYDRMPASRQVSSRLVKATAKAEARSDQEQRKLDAREMGEAARSGFDR